MEMLWPKRGKAIMILFSDEDDLVSKIEKLLEHLKRKKFLIDPEVEKAFEKVPLETFVSEDAVPDFLRDQPILFYYKTLSAPHMICIMLQELELRKGMKVLVLGAKSGYLEALISEIVGDDGFVYVLEHNPEICNVTEENLLQTDYERRTSVLVRDPLDGYESKGPWDRILVTGQVPDIPEYLKKQLADGGFILAPLGPPPPQDQEFTKIQRKGDTHEESRLGKVIFGPLNPAYARRLPARTVREGGPDMIEQFMKMKDEIIGTIKQRSEYVISEITRAMGQARVMLQKDLMNLIVSSGLSEDEEKRFVAFVTVHLFG